MKLNSVKVKETTIFYYTHGAGRPLLFLHGHRSDALRWQSVLLFLGRKFKVYAPDLPGFGQSPPLKNKPHTMENYGQYMNQLVEKLNLRDYLLFGGSMGGVIALKMLLEEPSLKPAKLVLVGTPYDKKYWQNAFWAKILLFLEKSTGLLVPLMEKIVQSDFFLSRLLWLSFPQEARRPEIIKYEMKQWRVMPIKIWWETMVNMLEGVNFSQTKWQTSIPTLILSSRHDQYFDSQKTIQGLQRLCPNSQVFFLPFLYHIPKGELKLKHLKDFQPLLEEL